MPFISLVEAVRSFIPVGRGAGAPAFLPPDDLRRALGDLAEPIEAAPRGTSRGRPRHRR